MEDLDCICIDDIIKKTYSELIVKTINEIKVCNGCLINHSSQHQHDCIVKTSEEIYEDWYFEALEVITPEALALKCLQVVGHSFLEIIGEIKESKGFMNSVFTYGKLLYTENDSEATGFS